MIETIKRFFLVPKCLLCREPLVETDDGVFCKKCRLEYEKLKKEKCKKCGKEQQHCSCLPTLLKENVKSSHHLFSFNDPLAKTAVYTLKQKNGRALPTFLATELAENLLHSGESYRGYAVSYAPRKAASIRKYGFDQAKILAQTVSERLHLPLLELFAHNAKSDYQKNLGKEKRLENAEKSYRILPYAGPYTKLLLVDDVITSGSTMHTLISLAKEVGFTEITVAYIARTQYQKDVEYGKEMDATPEKTEI